MFSMSRELYLTKEQYAQLQAYKRIKTMRKIDLVFEIVTLSALPVVIGILGYMQFFT